MQIFNTTQIHAWDEYTINNEPIASIDLMERASGACYTWLMSHGYNDRRFSIFCGKGNNGGDGLAIARLLANSGFAVNVYILEFGHKGTDDFQQNLARLHETDAAVFFIPGEANIPDLEGDEIVIDAIFGSGLNRVLEGLTATLVDHLNASGAEIISIDIPTGLFADKSSPGKSIIRAKQTLTFQTWKLSFLFGENQQYIGNVHILDIGLHPAFPKTASCNTYLTDYESARLLFKRREKFSHKGDYGSGALIAGSKGMMGAAVLAAKAFMKSGAGKLTSHIPEAGYTIMQTSIPEVMARVEKGENSIKEVSEINKYDVIAMGPGIGSYNGHAHLIKSIFQSFRKPMVIDADALNVMGKNPELLNYIPPLSILTPHPKEFERLFGEMQNDDERYQSAILKARDLNIIIVLKGAFTLVALPDGRAFFNSSGNPGMATGGSGDVLTGIIAGLLCQQYPAVDAAIFGVFIHGLAGDIAAVKHSMQAMLAGDIIDHLGDAFKRFEAPVSEPAS